MGFSLAVSSACLVMYRSERMLISAEWLEHFESLLGYLTSTWDGLIVVAGDINIDLLNTVQYNTIPFI